MTRSAGAGSASSQVLPITVRLSAGSICSRMESDGSTAVTHSSRRASAPAYRPVPAPTSIRVASGRSHGSRMPRNRSPGWSRIWLAYEHARGAHQSSVSGAPVCASRARTRSRQWAAQSTSSTPSLRMPYVAPRGRPPANRRVVLWGLDSTPPAVFHWVSAPVLAAIDRYTVGFVQHGGGWQESAYDPVSTIGLPVL